MLRVGSNMIPQFRNQKVLVTGGLGFVGSNLVLRLLSLGAQVTIVDSLIPDCGGNRANVRGFADRLAIHASDVGDQNNFARVLEGQDYLFNMVGRTSHLDSMERPFDDLESNVRVQLSILETARRIAPDVKVVFASTRQIYGRPAYLPVDEKHLVQPVDVNGIHKAAGEFYHILYNNVYGLRACCLRLTNTYGPRMRIKDARQSFIGVWIRSVLEDRPFEVWGGEQLRDFNYIDDCVDALLAAAAPEAAGRVFNLGGGGVVTLRQLALMFGRLVPGARFEVKDFPEERKRIDVGDFQADASLAGRHLGWSPKVGLEEGLKRTLEYFRPCLKDYL